MIESRVAAVAASLCVPLAAVACSSESVGAARASVLSTSVPATPTGAVTAPATATGTATATGAAPTSVAPAVGGPGVGGGPQTMTREAAQAALLDAASLPRGWSAVADTSLEQRVQEVLVRGRATPARCAALAGDAALSGRAAPSADAARSGGASVRGVVVRRVFGRENGGLRVAQVVSGGTGTGDAVRRVQTVADAVPACGRFTITDGDGTAVPVVVRPAPPSLAGDESTAFRLTTRVAGVPVVIDVVLVARGSATVSLAAGGVEPMPADDLSAFVRAAVGRLPA